MKLAWECFAMLMLHRETIFDHSIDGLSHVAMSHTYSHVLAGMASTARLSAAAHFQNNVPFCPQSVPFFRAVPSDEKALSGGDSSWRVPEGPDRIMMRRAQH
jgi:hypothetical protein